MKNGAFKRLPGEGAVEHFPGKVVDMSAPREERRIVLPGEVPPPLDLRRSAQAEIHDVCIRPKEQKIPAIGPWGPWALYPVQFMGQGRVWRREDGSMDLRGVGRMVRQPAPFGTRLGWYLIGAPIFHARLLALWMRAPRQSAKPEQA